MRLYPQAGLIALIALGTAFAAAPAGAESAAIVSSGNGSSSVSVATAPIGSTVVVNGKPCKVVAADKPSETGTGRLSGSATASASGAGSSVSIGTGGGGASGSVVVHSGTDANGTQTSNCVIVKPQSSADR